MFFDASHITIESANHRQDLLDDAANHRLAKLARAARKAARRAEPTMEPPAVPPEPVRPERNRAEGNADANGRYAVSR
jgi:hypothetical protein